MIRRVMPGLEFGRYHLRGVGGGVPPGHRILERYGVIQ
jgi:hypothetical protein